MADIYNSQLDAFSLYHKTHESTVSPSLDTVGPALPALGHALAGSTGTAISNVFVFPLDLIITRLQVQRQLRKNSSIPHEDEYRGIRDATQKIYAQEGGISGFYTGVVQDTAASVADSFLFFLGYNFLRQQRLQAQVGRKSLPVLDELGIGFLAGALAKLLTTPTANIVTRKQTSAMVSARAKTSTQRSSPSVREIALQIREEKGLQGFWSGYSASLILTLNPSLTFLFHELLSRCLLPRSQRDKPAASTTFLLAAVSKAVASTITYPFSLAKARAQASTSKADSNDAEVKQDLGKVSAGHTTGSKSTRTAARRSVFSTILEIARTEGIGGLYEGLGGQVLKGFFSHGITMLIKEVVHKFIIQLYFLLLKALKRYPSPQKLAQNASQQTRAATSEVRDRTQRTAVVIKEGALDMGNKGQEAMQNGQSKAQAMYESGKEQAGELYERGRQQAKGGYDGASKQAGTLLGKGQEGISATRSATQNGMNVTMEKARDTYDEGQVQVSAMYENSKAAVSPMQDTANSAAQNAKDLYQRGADQVSDSYARSKESAVNLNDSASSTAQDAKDLYQRGAERAFTTYQKRREDAAASQDMANTTVHSIADSVGRRIEEVGKSIRPDKGGDTR